MKQICLIDAGVDASPRVNEASMYPNIDNTFTVFSYTGERVVLRDNQTAGIKYLGAIGGNMQGLAVYDDTIVRFGAGSSHSIYKISDDGIVSLRNNFTLSGCGHGNALQFAPYKLEGNKYPYLYVATLEGSCRVVSIENEDAPEIIQTITSTHFSGNGHIGSDGHIWAIGCGASTDYRVRIVKYRRVMPSEGEIVNLTDDDILDMWYSELSYPRDQYLPQGTIIKGGKLFWVYGNSGAVNRGILVFDTTTHALLNNIDLTNVVSQELEDIDVWNDGLLLCTHSTPLYWLKF